VDSLDRLWQRSSPKNQKTSSGQGIFSKQITWTIIILASIIGLLIILNMSKGFYTEWLWFSSLGYGAVYGRILSTKFLVFLIAAVVFCVFFLSNVFLTTRFIPKNAVNTMPLSVLQQFQPAVRWGVVAITIFLTVIFGVIAQENWQIVLRYFNAQPFGVSDPVFNKEVSFYVFSLPFLNFVRGWLMGTVIITTLGCAALYTVNYLVRRMRFDYARGVSWHIAGLLTIVLSLFAWGYWLGIWELVFSERGVVFGASYADMHAKLPAQWILIGTVIICIGLLIYSLIRRNYRWVLYGIGGWIVVLILVSAAYPAIIQRFQVQPSELAKETPYIEYNIQYTREAFALDRIEEQQFPAKEAPDMQDIALNMVTINNIRLWDHRPLKDTYNQIQSFRLYYDFHDVDVDRYEINGNYQQVMLSARELSVDKLSGEAQTWVNERLLFTHGYGVASSPSNEISSEGLPVFLVKDIPPSGQLEISQPQIYFGEKTNNYIITNSRSPEFDYPMGDENVYNYYDGDDGVGLGNFIRKLAYAWQFGDLNILISSELTPESRILYNRNIQIRVNHLAPFLLLDEDPYLVIMDGRLFWIQDAYTVTNRYPYSEPISGSINYIRNSVKAVIDAYNGDVTFYITDPKDAIIQTYRSIFPELFKPAEQMPEYLRAHWRYPESMFYIQALVYRSYHMQDARVFYNKEDLWAIPREIYAESEQAIEPYYIIMRLPDEETEEFLLMLPFTPENKNNTIGWLAARCDDENYGTLLAYLFPKDRLVYGPSQIENRIQQDTIITEQLALWDRGGSRVIRGNLLMIPLGESNLYVEPVFLQARAGGLPELKRVIVAAGDQIVMRQTLAECIAVIFGTEPPVVEPEIEPVEPGEPAEPGEAVSAEITVLISQAQEHFDKALEYQKEGNWTGYGEEMDALSTVLNQLSELASQE